jgi:hydrogenase-1 operon protein HyaF
MSEINIPIAVTGPGTQPAELDGAELDILQLPSGMETYQSPILPEPEEVVALSAAKQRLIDLAERIDGYDGHSGNVAAIDLGGLDAANRQLVDQVLGEGEVSIRFEGDIRARIQESVLAGVWRVRYLDADDQVMRDSVEVGEIPSLLVDRAFAGAATCVGGELEDPPEGVLNAPSLLTELNDKVGIYQKGDGSHVINLTLLPQTEQDLAFLDERLGKGNVTVLSRGYGNCRISSTNTRHVWWVQYFNSQDKNILNTLEVTSVPDVACAAPEDIRDSAARLHEILEVYQ